MAYYLFHHVWDVPDSAITARMNHHLRSEGGTRKFQEEWLKIAIHRDLGGRDLVRNGGAEDRHNHTYRFAPITALEAFCLYSALSDIFLESEKPIPDELRRIYEERDLDKADLMVQDLLKKRRGNPKGGDITVRRLQLMKRKSSFLDSLRKTFEGITEQIDLGVDDSEEAILGLAFHIQRIIEKEVELYILNSIDQQASFDWVKYIENRHTQLDQERTEAYPELLKDIVSAIMEDNPDLVLNLLGKIPA